MVSPPFQASFYAKEYRGFIEALFLFVFNYAGISIIIPSICARISLGYIYISLIGMPLLRHTW
jgi:hypothetical protein